MGTLSNYSEGVLLNHVFNGVVYSRPATVYVGLSSADPLDDASGLAEPAGGAYARTAITFGAPSSRRVTQTGTVTFPQANASWGADLTHWALFDAATNGNMLAHGQLSAPKQVVAGNTPSISAGEVYVEFTAGAISTYLAHALLNLMFRDTAYTPPATYVALTTATVADGDTGSTITEPGDTYARVLVNPNGGGAPAWSVVAAGALSNGALVQFATPEGSWGTIVAAGIVDAAAAGNLLTYDNGVEDQAVGADDDVHFPAGDIDVSLD